MLGYLSAFHVIRPRYEKEQAILLQWIMKAHIHCLEKQGAEFEIPSLQDAMQKMELGTKKIKWRGTQLEDFTEKSQDAMSIFAIDEHLEGAPLKKRMERFSEESFEIFQKFYPESSLLPDHLIHVTCTGYVSPSPAQKIVSLRKGLSTTVTHAYHMGCYGAFPALRIGSGFLACKEDSQIDIVHTELCSLHMNPSLHTKEQLMIESLFADGFIKYSLSKRSSSESSYKVLALLEEIVPGSLEDMTWACEDFSFRMSISKEVPYKLANTLSCFLIRLAEKSGFSWDHLRRNALFAIHPGGPKIIEQVAKILHLDPFQIAHSLAVLATCGNMSSGTIPHIWEKMINDSAVPCKTLVVSLAFGPGLTISGGILEIEKGPHKQ